MDDRLFHEQIVVAATAAFVGIVYLAAGLRVKRRGDASSATRYIVAVSAFIIAALVWLHFLAPVVGYSLICVALVVVFLADLMRDERTRKRRVALLAPRRPVDGVPTIWIAIALLSTLALLPYILGGIEVTAALIAGACALTMAGIAARVATAPTQLFSNDPQTESIRDRACRARQVGMTCVLAIGSVFVFKSFVDVPLPAAGGLGHVSTMQMMVLWAGLIVWQILYVRNVSNAANHVSQ